MRPAGQFAQKTKILMGVLEKHPTASDSYLSEITGVTPRQVRRHLMALKTQGAIAVETTRYFRPEYGWCNSRTVKVLVSTEDDRAVFESEVRDQERTGAWA